jgi:hypothetical protein
MQQSNLILPSGEIIELGPSAESRARREEAAELGMTEAEVVQFIDNNPAIQRDIKKARKAYERLQATLKHEAEALARSKQVSSK